ncbi:Capsular biosynthesis protein [Candidatus Desulfarcum epimagneticum]|uniref:Capsular biosynthesis protein n=1 Tax=uncultured Desulfobacteraceae bacterium TaxID=218296 RepID=A0A484HME5_9BACT|nr:Capsular biosynthesis protein [uncultured Desulfobacteraceae bacterium]
MKKAFDVAVSGAFWILGSFPILVIAMVVKASSRGPVLYWSDRVGKDNRIFRMPKFRTMRVDAPVVATHLMTDPDRYFTPAGSFLRRTSLDELPQLYSVLKGDMSMVGPRPALFNQYDLIGLRTRKGIHRLLPGITGWAQINGRDDLPIPEKVELDNDYLRRRSFGFDVKIFLETFKKVANRQDVSH